MEEKEVKKTAGTTDCFPFFVSASDLLELFRTDCDIGPLAGSSLGNHNVPLQATSCFPQTYNLSSSESCGCHVCLADLSHNCGCAATPLLLPFFLW